VVGKQAVPNKKLMGKEIFIKEAENQGKRCFNPMEAASSLLPKNVEKCPNTPIRKVLF
jgi:hypothetical protein